MRSLTIVRGLLSLLVVLSWSGFVGCGGKVEKKYQPAQPFERWSNDEWAGVLRKVVTPDGYVRHDMLERNDGGVTDALFRYVGAMNAAGPESRPDLFPTETDRLAYYCNAYNAVCMYAVVKRGFPANHSKGLVPFGIFYVDSFPVGGKSMTLDFMEKTYLRPIDPRIHFAINCMSASCPPLRTEPYEPTKLDAQLDDQGRRFLSDPRGAQKRGDKIAISEIFKFFTTDFTDAYAKKTGQKDAPILDAIRPYADEDSPVRGAGAFEFQDYDWSLNRPR